MVRLADVILDRVVGVLDHPFTYRVPECLDDSLAAGHWVRVPLGRAEAQGVIWRVYEGEDSPQLKPIIGLVLPEPVLTQSLLDLAAWMSDTYLCYRAQAVRAMVPASVRQDRSARPKVLWYRTVGTRVGRPSLKQTVFEYIASHGPVDRRTVLDVFPNGDAALRALVAEEALEVMTRVPEAEFRAPEGHALTADQELVLTTIRAGQEKSWLLEGVTGSGKTEVYLALIQDALRDGKQALALLPEIALTPQTVSRFRERFGNHVAVWHSGLSAGERRLTWEAVRRHDVSVVVGARSAIFLPFDDLGLIVLDEEHEPSYKQDEHPRYHTREVALKRGQQEGARVLLGSATPSLETRYAADSGAIGYVRLPSRVLGLPLPAVEVVDMREELRLGNRDIFSGVLKRALEQTLAAQEQAILFLNRRGFATFVLCRSCGQAVECPECSVSMTFHQRENRLMCHYCERTAPVPTQCPECGSDKIRHFGAGTERVVDEVARLFPDARVVRADRDTLTRPQDYADLYHQFFRGEADVLVGTQMIAKGMDFPRVTLVGVVAADTALHLPDFRSAERTFQLLVQAGGRSGRSNRGGRVVVQTYNPDHYAVQWAAQHDYGKFYQDEIAYRRATGYPPFTDLWLLVFEGPELDEVRREAETAALELRQSGLEAEVLGPAPAPLARVRGAYRFHLLVKQDPHRNCDIGARLRSLQADRPAINITRDPYFMM